MHLSFKYIACLLLFPAAFMARGQHRTVFEHFTTRDGLTRSYIKSIVQDEKGFLWIGTNDGLNRYDGYGFTAYRNKPEEELSLSGNEINVIVEDSQNQIWVGTNGDGLNKYLPLKDGFVAYTTGNSNLKNNLILSLSEDSKGRLWIGTNEGLSCFHRATGVFTSYDGTSSAVNSILEDSRGRIWVATNAGLGLVDPKKHHIHFPPAGSSGSYSVSSILEDNKGRLWLGTSFHGIVVVTANQAGDLRRIRHFTHDSRDDSSLGSNMILTLFKDHSNVIWIGTDLGGLNRFDETSGTFIRYKNNNRVETSISSNNILAIEEDHLGNLWIGTNFGGLNFMDRDKVFEHFKSNPYHYMSNPVLSIYVDDEQNLWMGTDGNGLSCITPTGKFIQYTHGSKSNSIGGNTIQKIYEDKKGNLWLGTYSQGISVLGQNGTFKHYTRENGSGLSNNDVRAILTDSGGNLWVGTNGGGLNLLDKEKKTFRVYQERENDMHSLSSDSIVCLYEDSRGLIWVGTVHGSVCYFDPRTGNEQGEIDFYQVSLPVEDADKLYGNSVISITEDASGNMWFGNYVSGLTKMTFHTRTLRQYDESDGLPGNTINGLLPGKDNSLWISTNQGLARYYSRADTFIVYNELDGLQGNEFMHGSFYKSPGGKLYFGGINGVNAFYPDSIKTNPYVPELVITGIEVFNEPVSEGGQSSLYIKSVRKEDPVTLDYNQSSFSFSFVALSYPFAENNQYAVMLEGFEEQWRHIGSDRSYTYNNIPPGDYIFRVKGSNNDGVWNETGTTVKLKILPPWWQSGWAYLAYAIICGGIFYAAFTLTVKRAQLNERLRLVEKEKEYEQKAYQSKLDFFTNISHEFRTPLTLLLSPLEKITKTANDPFRSDHALMHKNARSLLRLVDQVLDFRKATDGGLKLRASRVDVVLFVRNVYDMFRELSTQKHVRFSFNSTVPRLAAFVDGDKMEKVIYNLLSNAFKFTPEYGKIDIQITAHEKKQAGLLAASQQLPEDLLSGFVEIAVTDNGKGIRVEELSNIFKRFYQVEEKDQPIPVGTGIGLPLVKELVNLHHGEVRAVSRPGKGSTFTIYLPLGIGSFKAHEINDPLHENLPEAVIHEPVFADSKVPAVPVKEAKSDQPLILIVEDNADVRFLLRTNLQNSFRIKEAANGKEALSIALEQQPVLVVSDVMMPVMNGYELCENLKNNIQTSHIPIILLTARNSVEQQIKGIETGADAYITKPFNLEFLEVRIKKLIENRKRIHREFLKDGILTPDEITLTPIDENFLQKVKDVLEKHMADPELKIEILYKEIGMSNTQFYTKVKALTGFSPQELVKDFRLKRAIQLLKESDQPINEIALSVGFSDARYFSRCFRKQFGTSPSGFINQHRAQVNGTDG